MTRIISEEPRNPFAVQTPEDIPAAEVVSLFVDVFGDFQHIPDSGHTFLNGPRGSGKSMMFRYLEPDCQQVARSKPLSRLSFFGVYIPIKNTEIKLTEFKRLEHKHAALVLNEHFLVVYVAVKFFSSLLKARIPDKRGKHAKQLREYFNEGFRKLLLRSGWAEVLGKQRGSDLNSGLIMFRDLFADYYGKVLTYLRQLAFVQEPIRYTGPLFGYLDVLLPLMRDVKDLGFMPTGPIFLLVDDADNLNLTQTRILNGWVSSRTSEHVSIKISTQLDYKTYRTATGQTIASPHDFREINISAIYTSAKNRYMDRVTQIVSRRLSMHGIKTKPEQFFPEYEKQEAAIARIGQELRERWKKEKRGFRANDDAVRYARPDYIKNLQGLSKSGSTYKYAGFRQLVHLSSGIIRYFLEPAALMYGEMRSRAAGNAIAAIEPSIQDQVVREQAREFFFNEFDKLEADEAERPETVDRIKRLRNLIQALGGTFHEILMSDAAERRVFSIAFSDEPDDDVLAVFRLGVQYGYFHESSIGNKEGTGRTRLYVLSRRLAPVFTLDPTSFAGYKFVTADVVKEAMQRPKAFVRRVKSGDIVMENLQIPLFEQGITG